MTPNDVPNITLDVLEQLLEEDPWGWSGVGIQVDDHALVIYNPRKSIGRQASDITHELSHNILEHQPATIIYSAEMDLGLRSFNQKQEDEANCLAWSLLLPREGLVRAKRRRLSVDEIASQFGVTTSLVTFRLNTSGVSTQLKVRRK
jgi:Zn-dependent peptidase ImmA (M78 family)